MIEPVAFGFNEQTAVNNYFQHEQLSLGSDIQQHALNEFNNMVDVLRANGLNIIIVKDTFEPQTPDSIFPNNWISFHGEGQVVLYPMFAENRRKERRKEIFDFLNEQNCSIKNIDDFTFWEDQDLFLEGTGSMVLDRVNRIAYAALSERTDKALFLQFCKVFEFKPIYFNANQTMESKRLPIYHTNVMMSLANEYAVICTDSIDDEKERNTVIDELKNCGKEIIIITEKQMHHFAGNMLQVENDKGLLFLVMSQSAYDVMSNDQLERLASYNDLIVIAIPTIEKIGGGSVRCMMAEIF
ncbi:MAG: amidinotransferase [Paludibacter sp.]|nr:amidinotransferase [Paludibacter sp.]